MKRQYIAIDLKSFYASVECIERGLDPMTTNLVVADSSRTEKTICLAVTPSLKAYGISGRSRLFEVMQRVREVNIERRTRSPSRTLSGESFDDRKLKFDPFLAVSYIIAPPQMAKYMEISTKIYGVYLKYIAPEDIHVYSVDEVFIDATSYLRVYNCNAHELALRMIRDVLQTTGITATAGIGTNLYLAKIAMDIMAKQMPPDRDGVRIAELDERSYREKLWDHRPLISFWRVGRGYASKLEAMGLYTMGDIARCSLTNEDILYKMFGVNAELLIDHAWGCEPCLMSDIKAYKPATSSISTGQVLTCPYPYKKARLIVHEMIDLMALELVEKQLVANQIVLDVGYDVECLKSPEISREYGGEVTTDHYGRNVPKAAHGTANLGRQTSSTMLLTKAVLDLFDRIVNPKLLVRRVNIAVGNIVNESDVGHQTDACEQLDMFTDYEAIAKKQAEEEAVLARERKQQKTIIALRKRYGKNAVLRGMNFEEGATTKDRNAQIGGHKA